MSEKARAKWAKYALKQFELNVGKAIAARRRAEFFADMVAEMGLERPVMPKGASR